MNKMDVYASSHDPMGHALRLEHLSLRSRMGSRALYIIKNPCGQHVNSVCPAKRAHDSRVGVCVVTQTMNHVLHRTIYP